jgi:hypothetical protein
MSGLPWCAYFDPDPDAGNGIVSQDPHDAGDGPLYFYVPVAGGAAVRVPVCKKHAEVLRRQFDAQPHP